jgi:hypothetical protein
MKIEIVKDILFDFFGILGVILIMLLMIWAIICLFDRIFKFSKYILKDTLILCKNGDVSYSCVSDLKERKKILYNAIKKTERLEELHKNI